MASARYRTDALNPESQNANRGIDPFTRRTAAEFGNSIQRNSTLSGARTMMNRASYSRLAPIAAVAALLLAGCNETPSETSKDVTQAREDASQEVSEARQEASRTENEVEEEVVDAQQEYAKKDANARENLAEVQNEALSETAKADFDVAMAKAKGIEDIEKEKCGALDGAEKTACLSAADATFAASEANAIADRDATLAAAAHYQ